MTSELRVTTLSNATGDGPATLTGQSAAKAHINFDNSGTATILNSFSISSITDIAVGQTTITFSNNFSDVNYVYAGASYQTGTALAAFGGVGTYSGAPVITSSALPVAYEDVDAGFTDYGKNTALFLGDLA
jgi:hypothetical protein